MRCDRDLPSPTACSAVSINSNVQLLPCDPGATNVRPHSGDPI